ncbi:MAG: aminoacyl-tRNA hydrolase [Patescibacteria group bacterium]|nr:aminoacyl-tRNA hydrolase [Patescibacteria group bacterium]
MKINPAVKIIIGLGNPDKEYANTYHNVGFLFIDYLLKNPPIIKLLKSDVFMNESGKFVSKTLKKTNIKPEEILIVHDDSDIEIGKYKISFGRGSAGHNGVESIIKSLKTKNFWRLRIGIRPHIRINQHKISINQRPKAAAFVLKKISKKDLGILEKVFEEAAEKV